MKVIIEVYRIDDLGIIAQHRACLDFFGCHFNFDLMQDHIKDLREKNMVFTDYGSCIFDYAHIEKEGV